MHVNDKLTNQRFALMTTLSDATVAIERVLKVALNVHRH